MTGRQSVRILASASVAAVYSVGIYFLGLSAPARSCSYPCGTPFSWWWLLIGVPLVVAVYTAFVAVAPRQRRHWNYWTLATVGLGLLVWCVGFLDRNIFVPSN